MLCLLEARFEWVPFDDGYLGKVATLGRNGRPLSTEAEVQVQCYGVLVPCDFSRTQGGRQAIIIPIRKVYCHSRR